MTWLRQSVQRAFARLAVAALCFLGPSWLVVRYASQPGVHVPSLDGVDRVEVSAAAGGTTRVIASIIHPARVRGLVAFADDVRHGWRRTWHTFTAPPVSACYFRGEELRSCIAVGAEILATWGPTGRGLQPATADHTRQFAALAGVSDTLVNRW